MLVKIVLLVTLPLLSSYHDTKFPLTLRYDHFRMPRMTRSHARNEPPSSDPNIAHIVRMLEEERQVARVELQAVREELQAAREERQANLAVVQHLVQATNQGRIT